MGAAPDASVVLDADGRSTASLLVVFAVGFAELVFRRQSASYRRGVGQ